MLESLNLGFRIVSSSMTAKTHSTYTESQKRFHRTDDVNSNKLFASRLRTGPNHANTA